MNTIQEKSVSLWMATADMPDAPTLNGDLDCDVVVVGSGIAGLSTAYELSLAGEGVIVLDRGALAGGMSSRTSAHLTSNIDDLYQELIRLRGEKEARSYFRSRKGAIDRIEEIQAKEKIDCDFVRLDGYLFPAKSDDVSMLQSELDACRGVGLRGVKWVDQIPIPDAGSGRSLVFPNQARFHPRKYLAGLAKAIAKAGGRLFANTPVVNVEEEREGVVTTTASGSVVRARAVVLATNSPIVNKLTVHAKQAPYRTYVIAGRVSRGAVADALYWDTLDPYHYVRLQPASAKFDWVLIGGEDHKTGEVDDAEVRLAKLEAWGRSLIPALGRIEYRWSGQVFDTVDYLPFTGPNPGNRSIFIHTGDSGEGLTNGVIGSLVLRDLVRGKRNRLAAMFSPSRVTIKSAGRMISENTGIALNLMGYATPGEISSTEELKRGEAGLLRKGTAKLAAYRDRRGKLHVHSASCTHSGCLLSWNSFETCWDCTCHGSHFSVDGEPLNAPATMPLAKIEEKAEAKKPTALSVS